MMLVESDAHSVYSSCLSCGYVYESSIISVFELEREQAVEEGRHPPPAVARQIRL